MAAIDAFNLTRQGRVQLNAGAGEKANFVSSVPVPLKETILLKDSAGRVVRTLVRNVERSAGSHTDVWDGRDDSGKLVRDGGYFVVASAVSGSKTVTVDRTRDASSPIWWIVTGDTPSVSDFFNNQPMTLPYRFDRPGRLTIRMRPASVGGDLTDCRPPRYCAVQGEYVRSGDGVFSWAGADADGVFRPDLRYIDIALDSSLPDNAVVVHGTRPAIRNVRAEPARYIPATGQQAVTFDLTTFRESPVNVSVRFLNQGSRSVLRTLRAEGVRPGRVSVSWDAISDSRVPVAPGPYMVRVEVTDELGNIALGEVLMAIDYR